MYLFFHRVKFYSCKIFFILFLFLVLYFLHDNFYKQSFNVFVIWKAWPVAYTCLLLLFIWLYYCIITCIAGRGYVAVVKAACLKSRRSNPTLAFKFQRNKMLLPRSLVNIQYCWEPSWLRGSVLGLRSPGLEFRILCLEGNVILFISPSSRGSPGPI